MRGMPVAFKILYYCEYKRDLCYNVRNYEAKPTPIVCQHLVIERPIKFKRSCHESANTHFGIVSSRKKGWTILRLSQW